MQLKSVVVNTTDVEEVVSFWSDLLDLEELRRSGDGFVWLTPMGDTGISLAFQKVDEPTEGRRRLHLDFGVEDLSGMRRRILDLGGSQVETHTVGDFTWVVMADPQGNEFCIAEGH
ncbi:MAG: VOC family protein [Acidimicrobiia bacterium]|nr:VOC family protein [Acidimicrobiia bacterium]